MKDLLCFIIALFPLIGYAQTKVAVYVTGTEGVEEATKQIVGSELVAGIVANPDYRAVERTADFLLEIQKEQGYQRSGNVDDQQIRAIGKQFGVDMVCVANIMPYQNSFYIQARMLDVESATVASTAREISTLASLGEIVTTAETLSSKLVGKQAEVKQYGQEYSIVLTPSDNNCDLISIDNTGSATVVSVKYITLKNTTIKFVNNSYIVDNETGEKYYLLGANGISTTSFQEVNAGIVPFTLTFQKIPSTTTSIDIIEPGGWSWKTITLRPYGSPDYYQFQDNTFNKYNIQVETANRKAQEQQIQKQQQQQQLAQSQAQFEQSLDALGSSITSLVNTINSYFIEIHNTKKYPCRISIDGHILGVVNPEKAQRFQVSLEWYGKLQAVQTSGYIFSPTVYTYKIPPQKKKANVVIRIQ